jgi:hypothetical protein
MSSAKLATIAFVISLSVVDLNIFILSFKTCQLASIIYHIIVIYNLWCKTMKTPCEIIVWNVVPIIRKEFAKVLIENHGLNQRKVADKLGITESAVSRYVSGKRGILEITDKEILEEIKKSSNKIAKNNGSNVIEETCRICRLMKSKEFVDGINYACD